MEREANRDKGVRTRASLRSAAYRLFLEQGYEGTTVAAIAAEAGVSHMTFFRHFPTKGDVVLRDEYDPWLERIVRDRPAGEPPVTRIRRALTSAVSHVAEEGREALLLRTRLILDTPTLRDRMADSMRGSQKAFERGLFTPDGDTTGAPLVVRAVAAACTAALTAALTEWAESGGTADLTALIDEALGALEGANVNQGSRP
ncbi:TetR/AcrR family transcriptional regulator [Nocardiopsis sp. JB363]|uniref:TetR/AcrR family transcriptional regulator n=1 Tax=Nocardiopsis sp. JB363 TaxID=1434837 RepID=UPI00097B0976|nr:TetR/AcrR family transcriptional regulator [Nocardiopsis sp. JB363]SIO84437.1 Transcriptional regulator, TetR family [Nocardiopsis sp. JB363]